ncbi:MAG TPA: SMC family ATPase [Streptosporangiaceae bacterium]|nr:SMC family ATPase [Streptosporangiaceae bacterium]
MRPVRLLLDGFGSYREPAEADFSDVDFFALVGPTGSGKSTVIDGLCFALYGTVPRWGRENVIAQALAPAANACRVCLVFEASGKRYGVVRALARSARGQVNTKEARIELLDPGVPAGAPLTELLEASVEPIAEGPEQVKTAVQQILGLTYEHFTQSVLLPQGRFSEFLHAKAADRQNLLVELLAFGVYDQVGQKARDRAKLAAERVSMAKVSLAELTDASEDVEVEATARVDELTTLATDVVDRLGALRAAGELAAQAASAAQAVRTEADLLAKVRTPTELAGLAQRIGAADQAVARCRADRDRAEAAEAEAAGLREKLPDKAALERLRDAHGQRRELTALLATQEKALAERQSGLDKCEAVLKAARADYEQAQSALAAAERAHAAVAVAQDLRVGEPCPVCLQPVHELPAHPVPADLAQARAAVEQVIKTGQKAREQCDAASNAAAAAKGNVANTTKLIEQMDAVLAGADGEPEVRAQLKEIAVADERLARATASVRAARSQASAADRERAGLGAEEGRATEVLGRMRDSVVQFGAPAVAGADLAAAWQSLTSWATAQADDRLRRLPELEREAGEARSAVAALEAELNDLLGAHGLPGTDPGRAEAAITAQVERAKHRLEQVRASRARAAGLTAQIEAHTQDERVASMLGKLLRASSFERWLCGEALDSLVIEASATLMELSGGQYQLDRDDRNELVVIDYADAGARRPVHTLSGGETFQASLALALALSRQVIGLSAGMRDLNSMFLDEGFGTLDEDTLEVVGTTLERLSSDSERMIGIITHVPALAERVPVRFVVSRAGTTSTLRKEGVT